MHPPPGCEAIPPLRCESSLRPSAGAASRPSTKLAMKSTAACPISCICLPLNSSGNAIADHQLLPASDPSPALKIIGTAESIFGPDASRASAHLSDGTPTTCSAPTLLVGGRDGPSSNSSLSDASPGSPFGTSSSATLRDVRLTKRPSDQGTQHSHPADRKRAHQVTVQQSSQKWGGDRQGDGRRSTTGQQPSERRRRRLSTGVATGRRHPARSSTGPP